MTPGVVQLTETFVTFAPLTVPLPLATVQVCPTGFVLTVTAKLAPVASLVAKLLLVLLLKVSVSALFCNTRVLPFPSPATVGVML